MRVLGIDPGLANCGAALFENGAWKTTTIHTRTSQGSLGDRADYISQQIGYFVVAPVHLIVVEHQRKYAFETDQKTHDLIDIEFVAGMVCGRVPHQQVLAVSPAQWKGQVPKHIHHQRLRQRVPQLGRCSKDALDAVGLVLYGLDTTNRGRYA